MKIYIDLDDCIFDLSGYMHKNYPDLDWERDLVHFVETTGFAHLDVLPRAHCIARWVREHPEHEYAICTSHGSFYHTPELCGQQKRESLKKHFPETLALIPFHLTASGQEKSKFASPDAVLIDDMASNCEAFMDNGGWAVIYSPFHHDAIFKEIEALCAREECVG